MSSVNPYSPPTAQVADIVDSVSETQPIRLFTTRGRIGRLRFLAYGFAGYLAFGAVAATISAIGRVVGRDLAAVGLVVAFVFYVAFTCVIAIKRAHDMGWPGWTIVLLLVPFVVFVWIFNGGTRGANRHGAPPSPNTWGVRILASILPAMMLVGVVLAIALPAVQQHSERARAAQPPR